MEIWENMFVRLLFMLAGGTVLAAILGHALGVWSLRDSLGHLAQRVTRQAERPHEDPRIRND